MFADDHHMDRRLRFQPLDDQGPSIVVYFLMTPSRNEPRSVWHVESIRWIVSIWIYFFDMPHSPSLKINRNKKEYITNRNIKTQTEILKPIKLFFYMKVQIIT